MREGMADVAEAVRRASAVAVCCHVSPDGDAIGSALALRLGLERLGKRTSVFCADKVPDLVAMLPGADTVRGYDSLAEGERFDLLFPVDTAGADRLGDGVLKRMLTRCDCSCQLDHHHTNPGYCAVNCVDGTAPAAGILVRELLGVLGIAIDADIAACLYAAIATDTGNFSYGNVTPEAFRVMAELLEAGLRLDELNRRLFVVQPEAQVRLTGRAIASMRLFHGGEIAVLSLSERDFAECGALPEHADTVVNKGLSVLGVRMALLVREHGGAVKASLRAVAPDTVSEVARGFGGGGHAQAAGCTLHGCSLEEAAQRVLGALERRLDEVGR